MAHTALSNVNATGAFVRTESGFRSWIAKGSDFEPEADRYHLYISLACPWASRCLAVLNLKGLRHVIGLSVVHPTWQRTRPDDANDSHCGWVFRAPGEAPVVPVTNYGSVECDNACIPDTVNGCKTVRELYDLAKDTVGKYSVPVLWDKKHKTIVNNESAEIIQMLNSEFDEWAKHPELDLYPAALEDKMKDVDSWVYTGVNNGVYRCGFAKSQEAYDAAVAELYTALDKLEEILAHSRYLTGSQLTASDIRLFVTLIRFDAVYIVYFKCNKKALREYPNLLNYTRELYQMPGIKESVDFNHIRRHYFTSHPVLNAYSIIPVEPAIDWLAPHGRDAL